MNELQVFNNAQFGEIRMIEEDEKFLFCGADVAKTLGYAKPANAVSMHCKGVTLKQGNDSLGRPQQMSFITEGDVYRLIAHSKLPSAEQFEQWVFDIVIPTIRRTGKYKLLESKKAEEKELEEKILLDDLRDYEQYYSRFVEEFFPNTLEQLIHNYISYKTFFEKIILSKRYAGNELKK